MNRPPGAGPGGAALLGLMAGPLLTMIDSSVVNVAAADVARELRTGVAGVQWVVSGYLLALATGLGATAWLARRFGTLPVYRAALVGFLAASALCAAAPGIGALVGARVLQGLLGAPLVPLAMSVLLGPGGGPGGAGGGPGGARGGRAGDVPATAGVLFFLGPALGPTLGGALVAAGGWRWIFLVNLPVGLAGLLALRRVPASAAPGPAPARRLDAVGLGLLAAGLPLLLWGCTSGPLHGWTAPATLVPSAAGALLLGAYAGRARRRPDPVLDLALLYGRGARTALLLCVLASVVAFGAVFLLPVFTQTVQHRTVLATGLALLPQGLLTGLATAAAPRLTGRADVRAVTSAALVALAVAGAGLLLLQPSTPLWVTAAILSARAVAVGFVVTPLLGLLLRPLRPDQLADGNTLFSVAQRLGGSLGVAALASVVTARSASAGPVPAFHAAGLLLVVTAAAGAVLALRLPAGPAAGDPGGAAGRTTAGLSSAAGLSSGAPPRTS